MILQKRVLNEKRITVLWNTVLAEIQADVQGVNGVITKNTLDGATATLATDGVFIFIGFEPNNSLVPAGTKMNANGYVVGDEKCETNIAGIFAVGDLKEKYAKQIVTAAADGCTAALAAAHYVEDKKNGE
jgi:thioredoxin reductase (NADPH)